MRKHAVALVFLLVASGCSSATETVAPVTTTAPAATTTVAPTSTTVAPTATTAPPTTKASATTTAATTTTTPTSTPSTSTVSSASVDLELDQAFGVAVEGYIAANWAGWSEGESLGDCLVENAAAIDAPAKQGVIDYGLEEVFEHMSRIDSYSLGVVWDNCETAPTSAGIEPPVSTTSILTVAQAPANPELDQAFGIAVEEYIAANWAGWSEGESLGDCLVENAAAIDAPAKQGVIDYGLEEVYNHISQTDSYTLGIVWNTCEQNGGTTATTLPDAGSSTTAVADIPDPELDQAFSTAIRATSSEGWSEGESTGDCLVANSSQITAAAKRGVIDYGLGEVFNHISLTDRSNLGMILEFCGAQQDSTSTEGDPTTGTGVPEVLTAECTLDVELAEVSCQASGYQTAVHDAWTGDVIEEGSVLTWTSTATSTYVGGAEWVFGVERLWDTVIGTAPSNDPPGVTPGAAEAAGHQEGEVDLPVSPEIQVFLEECQESSCQMVQTSLDGSALLSEDTSGLERIEIIVPFDLSDPITTIVPMGETIAHAIPGGHPGMDLQWSPDREGGPEIFASATGTITQIERAAFHQGDVVTDHITVGVRLLHEGFDRTYWTGYGSLALDFAHELGDTIEKGELLGHIDVNPYEAGFMTHWEFGVLTRFEDESFARDRRVCPMSFLDDATRVLMEEVWEAQPADAFKDAFPYICSNVYFGRNE